MTHTTTTFGPLFFQKCNSSHKVIIFEPVFANRCRNARDIGSDLKTISQRVKSAKVCSETQRKMALAQNGRRRT